MEGPPFVWYLEIAWILWDIPESRCLTTASHNSILIILPQSRPAPTRAGRERMDTASVLVVVSTVRVTDF